jgi:GTPase
MLRISIFMSWISGGIMSLPVVAIVGRPNVGKSQLFNRLIGERRAIVQDEPGITRDRLYGLCSWRNRNFQLVDTGGLDPGTEDTLKSLVQNQARKAIEEAVLILFVVDARDGLQSMEEEIAVFLRKTRKPVILIANKVDNFEKSPVIYDFSSLGFGEAFPLSALHGINIGELLDQVLESLESHPERQDEERLRITIAGRRNAGKSSLINAIAGEERSIVHHEAGTTRDSVDFLLNNAQGSFVITDTSGLRRKGKIDEKVEYYSAVRTLRAIDASECILLVIDAVEGVVAQDKRVAEEIQNAHKASIIVLNKWDLMEKRYSGDELRARREEYRRLLKKELYFIDYSPILFISALKKRGIHKILPKVEEVMRNFARKDDTALINRLFQEAQIARSAPSFKGKQLRIYYAFQDGTRPPRFTIKVNSTTLIHFSYRRYLENCLRKALDYTGTPVVLNFVKK